MLLNPPVKVRVKVLDIRVGSVLTRRQSSETLDHLLSKLLFFEGHYAAILVQ